MKRLIILLAVCTYVMGQNAFANENKIDIEASAEYVTSYIWRGADQLPDDNDALQPDLKFTFGDSGHVIDLWGSYGFDDSNDVDEYRVNWDYVKPVSPSMDVEFGMVYYGYPGGPGVRADSVEAYAGVAWPPILLHPTITVFGDFGDGEGYYANVGFSHAAPVGTSDVDFSLGVGYQDGYRGFEPGISDVTFSVATTFSVGTVALTPSLNYVYVPEDSVNADDDEIWFGVAASTEIRHTQN